jgi:hypothetical protein
MNVLNLGFKTRWVDGTPFKRAGHLIAEHSGPGRRFLLIGGTIRPAATSALAPSPPSIPIAPVRRTSRLSLRTCP